MNKSWLDKRIFNLPENKAKFLRKQNFLKKILYWFAYLIEELQGILYTPLYIIRFLYKLIKNFIFNIPKIPKIVLIWFILTFERIVFKHKFLRKILFKYNIKKFFKLLIISYIFLSFCDELQDKVWLQVALWNEFWEDIFIHGILWFFSLLFCFSFCWIFSLYFLDLFYWFRNNKLMLTMIIASGTDQIWPDILWVLTEAGLIYFDWICYYAFGHGFTTMDDSVELSAEAFYTDEGLDLEAKKYPERIMWSSWQRDHFFYKREMEIDPLLKQQYNEQYLDWWEEDFANYDRYTFY